MNKELVPELRFPEFSGEWEEKKLKDLIKFIKTYSYSRNDEGEGEYYHIHYGDIHSIFNGYIKSNTDVPSIMSNKEHIELENKDIILADASEDYNDLGKALVLLNKNNRKVIGGSHTFALRPKKEMDSLYFLYYSQSDTYKNYMHRIGTGISVFGISKTNLGKMEILLSSLKEQEKIGKFFYSIDKKLELQEKKIANLKEYKKGMMQRIFSQEIRFKDEDGKDYPGWEEKKLGEVAEISYGYTPSTKQPENFNGEYTWYGVTDLKSKYIKKSKRTISEKAYREDKLIDKGTLLMSFKLTIGILSITEVNCFTNEAIANFKWKENMSTNFMYYRLENTNMVKYGNQAAQGITLNSNSLNSIIVYLPIKQEQIKIANFLSSLDKKIELEEEKLENYKDYKKGLMQRMFI